MNDTKVLCPWCGTYRDSDEICCQDCQVEVDRMIAQAEQVEGPIGPDWQPVRRFFRLY